MYTIQWQPSMRLSSLLFCLLSHERCSSFSSQDVYFWRIDCHFGKTHYKPWHGWQLPTPWKPEKKMFRMIHTHRKDVVIWTVRNRTRTWDESINIIISAIEMCRTSKRHFEKLSRKKLNSFCCNSSSESAVREFNVPFFWVVSFERSFCRLIFLSLIIWLIINTLFQSLFLFLTTYL